MLGWNAEPEDLKHIPEHWLVYPAQPVSLHYMLGLLYCVLMMLSLIGNGLVIWVFAT